MGNDAYSDDEGLGSTLMQLATADILNDRDGVTGRKRMPKGFVKSLIRKFPIRISHAPLR
jgi:hypothetical protein